MKALLARIGYGLLFVGIYPALLILWARALSRHIPLPTRRWPVPGWGIAAAGLGLMAWGMAALWHFGRGLPMNAFPPTTFVRRGPYRYFSHPIYVGFCMICMGVALATGSPGGWWVVTPVVILGSMALVLGFENPDLRKRFGPELPPPLLRIPPDREEPPQVWDRISILFLVFLPWLLLYETLGFLVPSDAMAGYFAFERGWPILEWTQWIYVSAYLVVLVPFGLRTQRALRRFAIAALVGIGVGMLVFLVVPLTAPPRPMLAQTAAGRLLELERADGMVGGAFPSFHVFWAMLAAWALMGRGRWIGMLAWVWATAVAASCITTGMHALIDLPAAGVLFLVSIYAPQLWRLLRSGSQAIANSWHEWRIGPLRIINHGLYAGLAAFVGVAGTAAMAGPGQLTPLVLVTLCSLVGAGLWGQWLEGSSKLLRPFGYYGSLLGATIGTLAVAALPGTNLWLLASGLTAMAPFIQAIGRLRCLVQGCCHGSAAPEHQGIRYTHPRSRVCRLAELAGVPVYPTPLYSILANIVIGLLLIRMRLLGCEAPFIVGGYFLLSSLARFVEEAYRGEPQTPVFARLHSYQWLAVAGAIAGGAITVIPTAPVAYPPIDLTGSALAAAAGLGVLHALAMGADFPEFNYRFSRLA